MTRKTQAPPVTTVGQLLERNAHLLDPSVNAAHSFADVLAGAKAGSEGERSAKILTHIAMLRQAAIKALARMDPPPETPIRDELGEQASRLATPDISKEAVEAKVPSLIAALLDVKRAPRQTREEPSEETAISTEDARTGYAAPVDLNKPLYPQLEDVRKELQTKAHPRRMANDGHRPTTQS